MAFTTREDELCIHTHIYTYIIDALYKSIVCNHLRANCALLVFDAREEVQSLPSFTLQVKT